MNPLLRALWNRLLPPGGDVAVARPADDDREAFIPGPRVIHAKSWLVTARPQPICLKDAKPEPADLDRHGRCWWWDPDELMPDDQRQSGWCLGWPIDHPGLQSLWMPYRALCDPSAEP
jgi:hypothetical protein